MLPFDRHQTHTQMLKMSLAPPTSRLESALEWRRRPAAGGPAAEDKAVPIREVASVEPAGSDAETGEIGNTGSTWVAKRAIKKGVPAFLFICLRVQLRRGGRRTKEGVAQLISNKFDPVYHPGCLLEV